LLQIGGFIAALIAITLISSPERVKGRPKGLGLALLSGCGFGCFFILISRVSLHSTFWPLAIARLSAVLLLSLLALLRKPEAAAAESIEQPGKRGVLPRPLLLLILGSGVLDSLGNAFFVLAAHTGRLDVAAVLSSLYPAATTILAIILLRERVNTLQAAGIVLALLAIPLISL
jgi:drug/metabolite transporter (DMT)-like permease